MTIQKLQGIWSVEAEQLAQEFDGDTVYNWIHPNNDRIISFLKKRGYNVLNLIEVRRARLGEETSEKIKVGNMSLTIEPQRRKVRL